MESLQFGYLVISRIMDGDILKGFRVVNTTGSVSDLPLSHLDLVNSNSPLPFKNAEYDTQYKTLVGINGCSLTNSPSITKELALVSKDGITVLCNILDKDTEKPIGVVAYNALGTKYNIKYSKLNELVRKFNACNFKLEVDPKYGLIAKKKDGTDFEYIKMEVPKVEKKNNDNCVFQSGNDSIPTVKAYSMDFLKDNEFSVPCQDKLVRCMLNMQALTPYYYTVLAAITRKPFPGMNTMGVTEDTLYYDMNFVCNLKVSELTFVLIHEIMHIAMQHSVRFGNRKNHDLWNIATDLYINSIICNDFGVQFGGPEVNIGTQSKPVSIKTPDFGVYAETVGRKIDLAIDTPESLYEELLKENPMGNNGSSGNQGNNQSGGQGGQGSQGSQGNQQAQNQLQQGMQQVQQGAQQAQQNASNNSQSQQAQQQIQQGLQQIQQGMQSGNQQQVQQGMQQVQQGCQSMLESQSNGCSSQSSNSSQSSSNSNGDKSNQLMSDGCQNIQSAIDKLNNNQSQQQVDDFQGQDGDYSGTQEVNVIFNGKKLKGTIMKDIMSNKEVKNSDDLKANIEASRKALQRISTKIELEEKETGKDLVKNAGDGSGLTQRYIEFGLSAGVDWRVLFRNICKDKPKKTFTLAQPNVDYMNMGMTIADRRAIGKPTHISKVKFAIDVSGSVSQKELQKILSEINNIFTQFKLDGELIYWSTSIGDAGMFSNLKDMLKVKPLSDGGTDVSCVFEYLAGETKVHGKFESDKVKDIKAIFIITDGYFSHNYSKYKSIFGKKVVWLITGTKGNVITFNPPFGRVLSIDVD